MTSSKRDKADTTCMIDRVRRLGINREDAQALRRISMTLHRWYELECGDDYGCIERGEATDKPYWLSSRTMRRSPIADREKGAHKRLAVIMARYPTLTAYLQTDPRGASLYLLTAEHLADGATIDSIYNRGVAVYK